MRSIIITGIIILIVISLILVFGFSTIGSRNRTEENWDISDSYGSVNGTWGTEIIVEYEDGTIENLNEPLPILGITFKDKKVNNFQYILSSRGTSDEYNVIEIDMSDFAVLTTVEDQDGEWGDVEVSSDIITLDMDGTWYNLYSVQVDANELQVLQVDNTYNLSFTPSGSITYRGTVSVSWTYVPLPNWFYLNFLVNGDIDDDGIPNDEDPDYDPDEPDIPDEPDEVWIEVEFTSGVGT